MFQQREDIAVLDAQNEMIVRQVRTAIAWIHRHRREHRVDPDLPADGIKSALTTNHLFDVRPLVSSFANEWLALDQSRTAAVSPAGSPPG